MPMTMKLDKPHANNLLPFLIEDGYHIIQFAFEDFDWMIELID